MRYKTPLAQRKAVRRHQRKINSDPDKRYQRTKQTYASHARTFARKYATHAGEIDAFVSELLAIKKSRFGTASTTDDNGRISSKSTAVDGDQIHELTQAWITNTAANAAEINHLLRDLNRFKIERFGDDHQRLMDTQNQPAPVPATPKRPDWRNPYERQQLIFGVFCNRHCLIHNQKHVKIHLNILIFLCSYLYLKSISSFYI